jgi:hypothetical protein
MPPTKSILRRLLRRSLGPCVAVGVAILVLSAGGNAVWAWNDIDRAAVSLQATVPIPGTGPNTTAGRMFVFDISWVDQASQIYYLADRSNAVVDMVDATTNTLLAQLDGGFRGFTGNNGTSGPNGVTTAGQCLFVTDSPSRVVSFDTTTFPPIMISAVSTASGDLNRADELAYDANDNILMPINNADTPPFGTFIKVDPTTCAMTQPTAPPPGVTAPDRILFNVAAGVDATNGAEQPQWDPIDSMFYVSIPQIGPNVSSGGVVAINPLTHQITRTFPISFCQPSGLTQGPGQHFLLGCNAVFDIAGGLWSASDPNTAAPIQVILNVRTGVVEPVPGVGVGDEVYFNPGDGNYYTASSTSPLRPFDLSGPPDAQGAAILGVIDAVGNLAVGVPESARVIQLVPTFNVPAVTGTGAHPASTAHSVAVDASNNEIFVPLGANNVYPNCLTGCIAVYGRPATVQ